MSALIKTRLQKFVLLLAGLLIFIRLADVGYGESQNALLHVLGIAVFAFVLIVLLKDYHPQFHKRPSAFVRKYRYPIITLAVICVILLGIRIHQKNEIRRNREAVFHSNEVAYQSCLDRVSNLSTWHEEYSERFGMSFTNSRNQYFDEWAAAGRPGYDRYAGGWEKAFMQWLVLNHKDFCGKDSEKILTYLAQSS